VSKTVGLLSTITD